MKFKFFTDVPKDGKVWKGINLWASTDVHSHPGADYRRVCFEVDIPGLVLPTEAEDIGTAHVFPEGYLPADGKELSLHFLPNAPSLKGLVK